MTEEHQKAILETIFFRKNDYWDGTNFPWSTWKLSHEASYFSQGVTTNISYLSSGFSIFTWIASSFRPQVSSMISAQGQKVAGFLPIVPSTQLVATVQVYYKCNSNQYTIDDGYGLIIDNEYHLIPGTNFGLSSLSNFPTWCAIPTTNSPTFWDGADLMYYESRGVSITEDTTLQTWQFNYCTNKYW